MMNRICPRWISDFGGTAQTAFDVGAELIHAHRVVTGGDSGSLNRLQFSAQYSFL